MSDTNSLTQIWLHIVIGTKYRWPFITSEVERCVFQWITEAFRSRECDVKIINGTDNHVHVLIRLSKNWSVANLMREVKGSSAYRINNELAPEPRFQWQRGYSAFSVQYNDMDELISYIRNQKVKNVVRWGATKVASRKEIEDPNRSGVWLKSHLEKT